MRIMNLPDKQKLSKSNIVFEQAMKGMGFVPNSLKMMAHKNNILGAFSMLFANIRGFSSVDTSPWIVLKIFFKNLLWSLKAKK